MRHSIFIFLTIITIFFLSGFKNETTTWIIEVEGDPHQVKKEIEETIPLLDVVTVYDKVFNGLAIKGPEREFQHLNKVDAVVNRHPVVQYRANTNINESVPFIKKENGNLSNLPYTGQGVKVGVIDTGIDYTHPDLSKNYKGGFDVVDFDKDPMESTGNGATLHGTHVAGVIGANGKMKGIAPNVELYGYRALGPGGVGNSVQVIAAIEEAVKDKMDIINLSLGNDVNGPDWPTSVAVNKAVELGITVVVAAGNSGPEPWTVGSPATASNAIAVGASTPPLKIPILYERLGNRYMPLSPLMSSAPWNLKKKYTVVYGGIGKSPVKNAEGKIVLMKRGTVPFTEKAKIAQESGAVALIIYNNEKGLFQGALSDDDVSIPVVSMTKKNGEWLRKHVVNETAWVETKYAKTVDQLASFSSRGPVTSNWTIKPDVLAPGVDITSTVPGGYQSLQGTSMAAPHIAGIAALMKEAHPDWGPEQIKTAMLTTADPLQNEKGDYYLPTEQGMGKVDVAGAIKPQLNIKPSQLNYGRFTGNFPRKTLTIKITNTADKEQEIQFKRPKQKMGMRWMLPKSFTLKPDQSKKVSITLSVQPQFMDKGLNQGWIEIKASDDTFKLPYLFMIESSDYPRAMGLEIAKEDFNPDKYRYQFYLPEDADHVEVDLYRSDTLTHVDKLLKLGHTKEGVVEGTIPARKINVKGLFIAVITVEKNDEMFSYTRPVLFSDHPPA